MELLRSWTQQGLYGMPVAFIDFETTGLVIGEARAVSLAIVHMNLGINNRELVYNQVFNPEIPIPKVASDIHGITDEEAQKHPTFIQELPKIMTFLQGRMLAAYNLPFDWGILDSELFRTVGLRVPWFGICGKVVAMQCDDQKQGRGYHRLVSVAKRRGITFDAHDAAADAQTAAQILDMMLPQLSKKLSLKFKSFRDFWAWQRVYAISRENELRHYFESKGKNRIDWPWTDL